MFPEKELVQENEMNRILKYVDKKSEHELFLKRKQIDLKEKAQYHWALLRESVSSAMKV
uniref:Uncharacterized protein n=1 Tax=Arion vulgaris TaxID=1028688 RepID=A0A0B7BWY5_9EUPU